MISLQAQFNRTWARYLDAMRGVEVAEMRADETPPDSPERVTLAKARHTLQQVKLELEGIIEQKKTS